MEEPLNNTFAQRDTTGVAERSFADDHDGGEIARKTLFGIPLLLFLLIAVIIALAQQLLKMQRKLQRVLASQTLPISNSSLVNATLPEELVIDSDEDQSQRAYSEQHSIGSYSTRAMNLSARRLQMLTGFLSPRRLLSKRGSGDSSGIRSLVYSASTLSAQTNRVESSESEVDHAHKPCMQPDAAIIPEDPGSAGGSSQSSAPFPSVFDFDEAHVKLQRDGSTMESKKTPPPDIDGVWDAALGLCELE